VATAAFSGTNNTLLQPQPQHISEKLPAYHFTQFFTEKNLTVHCRPPHPPIFNPQGRRMMPVPGLQIHHSLV